MTTVICLQFWQGDIREMAALGRFMADIEPRKRDDVKIRFIARADCPHPELGFFKYVGQKFDVSWTHSKSTETGWPDGPNGMAMEILREGTAPLVEIGWQDVDTFILLEPDCVPLSRDWLNMLLAEWRVAQAEGKYIMGSFRQSGPSCGHINGNCVVRADLAKHMGLARGPRGYAWDCWLAPRLKDHWRVTGLLRNDFQSKNATEALLRTPETGDTPPVLVHGYKDASALEIARKWTL
jgi:hypothetical protein